jgi:hypothetical protein
MGNKGSKTTEIYTHVTEKSLLKTSSPFDELKNKLIPLLKIATDIYQRYPPLLVW